MRINLFYYHCIAIQHKYIRIGGGYRHSYWMVKAMMEAIELEVGIFAGTSLENNRYLLSTNITIWSSSVYYISSFFVVV